MKEEKKENNIFNIDLLKRITRDLISTIIFLGSFYYTISSISILNSSFGYSSAVEFLDYLETFFFSIAGVCVGAFGFVPEINNLLDKRDEKLEELDDFRINNRKELTHSFSDIDSLEKTKKQIEFLIKEKERLLSSENEKNDNNIVRVKK